VTRDQHTTEQAPGKPLNGPQGAETPAAGTPGGPGSGNGAQAGAESHAPWTPYEARAFNAVLPALREAGEWLPLTARRAVARAVLAELKPELAALADYENRITWHTTCSSCARILDSSIRETERAEQAVAAIARVRAACDEAEAVAQREFGTTGIKPLWVAVVRDALDGITQPAPAHNAGPSVAECAAHDRAHWADKYAGEQQ
jgi:hypothetical protein